MDPDSARPSPDRPGTTLEASAHEPDWDPTTLDLDAYLDRIGFTGARTPTVDVLREVVRAHVASIPFENLDIPAGRGIAIGLAPTADKLVHRRRGGYCFEQNPLLGAALTRLGFSVRRGAARGPIGPEQGTPIAYGGGHAMLVVEAEGRSFLCDVGVGYLGPSVPVPLVAGQEIADGAWRYRVDAVTAGDFSGWMLRMRLSGRWTNVYAFTGAPVFHSDYEDQNFIAASHPSSPFVGQLIVQRTGPDERWTLRDGQLTRRRPDQEPATEPVEPSELPDLIARRFGLALDAELARFVVDFAATRTRRRADEGHLGV